jgi:hypothetical protein
MKHFVSTLILLVFLASCGGEPYQASRSNEAKIGSHHSNFVQIGAVRAPMPKGRWELVSRHDFRTTSNFVLHNTVFAKHDNERVTEFLTIRANDSAPHAG